MKTKNRLRLAKVILKNKLPRFFWFTVYIALHKVNFSLVMGLSFLVLHDIQILYTDAQIFQLGGHDVL